MRGLSFFVEQELYIVDVNCVMKVVRNIAITPVPAVSDAVIGIVNLKGIVITVLSLPTLIGQKQIRDPDNTNLINAVIFKPLSDSSDQMGLMIDAPGELISIHEDDIQSHPMKTVYEEGQIISALASANGMIYRIVDIASIINRFSDSGAHNTTGGV